MKPQVADASRRSTGPERADADSREGSPLRLFSARRSPRRRESVVVGRRGRDAGLRDDVAGTAADDADELRPAAFDAAEEAAVGWAVRVSGMRIDTTIARPIARRGELSAGFAGGENTDTLPRMNRRLVLWSVVSALAGFLFGFDTVVISGAEQTIQSLWGLSAGVHGLAMGAALYGTVVGSLFGGWPTDRFGRKPTLIAIGVLYVVSAFGCAFATVSGTFIAARFLGGLGIGVSTVAAPALHLGDRAARLPRPPGRHVPVQHRLRHRRRLRVERRHRPASAARTRGAGCSASPRCRRWSTR